MIYGGSSHLRSAYDNVRKYVGIPDCLTIASKSYKNCFQYAAVPWIELINGNALSPVTNLSTVSLKSIFLKKKLYLLWVQVF